MGGVVVEQAHLCRYGLAESYGGVLYTAFEALVIDIERSALYYILKWLEFFGKVGCAVAYLGVDSVGHFRV